jgi:hypothetical protein
MSETITLYVPEKFVSETRKIDFVYRHKQMAKLLNDAISALIAMQPVPEDYINRQEYNGACKAINDRFHTLSRMVVEVESTWMLANLVKIEEEG